MTDNGSVTTTSASPGESGTPLMRLSGISKSFDGTTVLKSMDLDVVRGEILILLGENGAGKSTLKNIMCGLLAPDGGSIEFQGTVQTEWNPRKAKELGLAAIHQELSLFPNLSVAENVNMIGLGNGRGYVETKDLERRTNAMFQDLLEIGIDSSILVAELPLATRQLVEIVKAIRTASSVLVLDEPTTSLSIQERRQLFTAMRRLRDNGYALVHVTHFLEEIEAVGDRVAIMRDGELVALNTKNELTVPQIEQLMVGRELAAVSRPETPPHDGAPVVLDVSDLGDAALLHDINLSVRSGEVVGIAGLSGAGRSELMQALVGLRAAHGDVKLEGRRFNRRSVVAGVQRGIVLVSEDRRTEQAFLERTVLENLTASMLGRVSNKLGLMRLGKERQLVGELIKKFGVRTDSANAEFGSMSGGNQQKAILARWLSLSPKVCLLDEPTKGIDVGAKAEVQRTIFELASTGVGLLVVSSDLPELFHVSDRILVMKGGTITAELHRSEFDATTILRAASSEKA
ncbi:sugar ABC transporter ATP-binding protein [Glaciihabitans sp. UYNi722]|uniref:sugar ABC transporter ATP-binding protein n=1 Tax=Glaciihabitans sp. UYNi722 TaxID=3156344 RepID=UPI0033936CCF